MDDLDFNWDEEDQQLPTPTLREVQGRQWQLHVGYDNDKGEHAEENKLYGFKADPENKSTTSHAKFQVRGPNSDYSRDFSDIKEFLPPFKYLAKDVAGLGRVVRAILYFHKGPGCSNKYPPARRPGQVHQHEYKYETPPAMLTIKKACHKCKEKGSSTLKKPQTPKKPSIPSSLRAGGTIPHQMAVIEICNAVAELNSEDEVLAYIDDYRKDTDGYYDREVLEACTKQLLKCLGDRTPSLKALQLAAGEININMKYARPVKDALSCETIDKESRPLNEGEILKTQTPAEKTDSDKKETNTKRDAFHLSMPSPTFSLILARMVAARFETRDPEPR